MPELIFVAADDTGRVKRSDLLTVRSHCMRDKNRKEGSRRSLRHAMREAGNLRIASRGSDEGRERDMREHDAVFEAFRDASEMVIDPALRGIPAGLQDEYYDIRSTYSTYVETLAELLPVYRCMDFDEHDRTALDWMHHDSAFFHSIRLYTSAMGDIARGQSCPSRPTTLVHLRQTLAHLNDSLSDQNAQRKTSIVHTVVMLTIVSALFHDNVAAEAHLTGLERIMSLHGGRESLNGDPKLQIKFDRLDIDYNLSTGNPPRFSRGLTSWRSIFQDPNPTQEVDMFGANVPTRPLSDADTDDYIAFLREAVPLRLAIAFQDLQQLARLLHGVAGTGVRISGDIAQRAFESLKARLLELEGTLEKGLAECLRLCMLVYLTTTFRLPGRKAYYWSFISGYRESFAIMHWSSLDHWQKSHPQYRDIVLWLLMAGAMTAFDDTNPCFCDIWDAYVPSAMTWEELQEKLRKLAWTDVIHNAPGRTAFGGMMSGRKERDASENRTTDCQTLLSKQTLVYRFVA
ncbi:hypothetical protein BDV96DRAFT_77229 [Lophiotrema nucula]|uniref:Uncharacterized protein n=1 Tax=Lophiotrema nucula TaxID=690887 RepID=A0A6A5Z7W4_9PLEO|nr:hypothetical protein BDV96DRAFT_77229 [Lophiotrema nucula]